MGLEYSNVVRVGVKVERNDSAWLPFTYSMFWCKQKDVSPSNMVREWAGNEVEMLSMGAVLPGQRKMGVGEVRRYWIKMRLSSYRDYWGEYDSSVEILKCRRAK